jgi:hypothetical protein
MNRFGSFYSGARRWIAGDATTVAALRQEGFDFGSHEAGEILARAAWRGDRNVVRELIAAGAPLDVKIPREPLNRELDSALYFAVQNPDIEV